MSRMPISRAVTPAADFSADVFVDVDLSLTELYLAGAQNGVAVIENRIFRGCRLQGPAVMLIGRGTTFEDTNFGNTGGDPANMILRPAGPKVIGAIPVVNCRFEGCEFFNLGFTGAPKILEQLLALPGAV